MALHFFARRFRRANGPLPSPPLRADSSARPALCLLAVLCLLAPLAQVQARPPDSNMFTLSFAELAEIEVTSVSKKAERLSDAATSVFVITNDDLRRSGVSNVPEALRLAPNLHVAAASGNGYTISARGLNNNAANKLLVLIDGRSVYTPLFAGVFWDVQDVLLDDVERIEVISGPGSTLWGTNAVNGVINIITRASKATQGVLASTRVGSHQSDVAARYGATFDNGATFRLFGKYTDIAHTRLASGAFINDAATMTRIGLRADWHSGDDQVTLLGNAYRGAAGQPEPGLINIPDMPIALGPITLSGANLAAQWERTLDNGTRLSWQTYFDRTERRVVPTFAEVLDIVDTQLQASFAPTGVHTLSSGINYRVSMDRVTNSAYIAFLPAQVQQTWSSLFVQDEFSVRDNLRLTLGARIEHNDYTGKEFLPSARLGWKITPEQFVWSAISRAVRAPSRLERDLYVPAVAPFMLDGGAPVRSELATVYELGYRGQPAQRLSTSVTLYHTEYDFLRSQQTAPDGRSVFFSNMMTGKARGIEMWAMYQASPRWRLNAGFTALKEQLTLKPGSNDFGSTATSGQDPAHKLIVRSSLDLSSNTELDITVRQLAALSAPTVPAYTALDLRLGWRPNSLWELALGARNLGGGHGEFGAEATRTQFERIFYAKAVARF